MHKPFLIIAALSGALSVVLGAFGAHDLKKIVSPEEIAVFQTGVQYQVYHSLALLAVALIYESLPNRWVRTAGYLFVTGIIFFSGSLYLITCLKASAREIPTLVGVITPLGGMVFILGWLSLLIGILKKN
jgi:uncharacterized membrane protein YgdD (TMEM256/DUF423 family)